MNRLKRFIQFCFYKKCTLKSSGTLSIFDPDTKKWMDIGEPQRAWFLKERVLYRWFKDIIRGR